MVYATTDYVFVVAAVWIYLHAFKAKCWRDSLLARQSICSAISPSCPEKHTDSSVRRWMSAIDTCQSGLPIPIVLPLRIEVAPVRRGTSLLPGNAIWP